MSSNSYKTDFRSETKYQNESQKHTHHPNHDEIRKQKSYSINLEELKSRETTRIATADDVRALLEAEFKGIAEIQTSREISVEEFNYIESQYRKNILNKIDSETKCVEEHKLENILENPEWKKHYGLPILSKNEVIDLKEVKIIDKKYEEMIPSSTVNVPHDMSISPTILTTSGGNLNFGLQVKTSSPLITVTTTEHTDEHGTLRHDLKQKRHVLEEIFVEENETFYEKTTPKKVKKINEEIAKSIGEFDQNQLLENYSTETGIYPRQIKREQQPDQTSSKQHVIEIANLKNPTDKKLSQSELVVEDANLFTDKNKVNSWFSSDIKIKPLFSNKYQHYVINKASAEYISKEEATEKNLTASHAAETRVSNLSLKETENSQKEIVVSDIETFKNGKFISEPREYDVVKIRDDVTLRPLKHKLENTETKLKPKSKIIQEEMFLSDPTVFEDKQFKTLNIGGNKMFTLPKTKTMPPKFKVKEKFKIKKMDDIENKNKVILVHVHKTTIAGNDGLSNEKRAELNNHDYGSNLHQSELKGRINVYFPRSAQQEIVIDDPDVFRETTLTRRQKEKTSKVSNRILNDILADVSNLSSLRESQGSSAKTFVGVDLENKTASQEKKQFVGNTESTVDQTVLQNFKMSHEIENTSPTTLKNMDAREDNAFSNLQQKVITKEYKNICMESPIETTQLDTSKKIEPTFNQEEIILEDKTIYADWNKPKNIVIEHGKIGLLDNVDKYDVANVENDDKNIKSEQKKSEKVKKKKKIKLNFGKKNQGETVKDKSFVYEDATKIRFPTLTKNEQKEKSIKTTKTSENKKKNHGDKSFWNWNSAKNLAYDLKATDSKIVQPTSSKDEIEVVNEIPVDVPSEFNFDNEVVSEKAVNDEQQKIEIKVPSISQQNVFLEQNFQDEILLNEQSIVENTTKLVVNLDVKDETDDSASSPNLKQNIVKNVEVDISTQNTQTTPIDVNLNIDKAEQFVTTSSSISAKVVNSKIVQNSQTKNVLDEKKMSITETFDANLHTNTQTSETLNIEQNKNQSIIMGNDMVLEINCETKLPQAVEENVKEITLPIVHNQSSTNNLNSEKEINIDNQNNKEEINKNKITSFSNGNGSPQITDSDDSYIKENIEINLEDISTGKGLKLEESKPPEIEKSIENPLKININEKKNIYFPNINLKIETKKDQYDEKVVDGIIQETVETTAEKEKKKKIHLPHINFKKPTFHITSQNEKNEIPKATTKIMSTEEKAVTAANKNVEKTLVSSEMKIQDMDKQFALLQGEIVDPNSKLDLNDFENFVKVNENQNKYDCTNLKSVIIETEKNEGNEKISLTNSSFMPTESSFNAIESSHQEITLTKSKLENVIETYECKSETKIQSPSPDVQKRHKKIEEDDILINVEKQDETLNIDEVDTKEIITIQDTAEEIEFVKKGNKFKLPKFHFLNFKTPSSKNKEKNVKHAKPKKKDKKSKIHLSSKNTQNEIVVGDIPVIADDSQIVANLKKLEAEEQEKYTSNNKIVYKDLQNSSIQEETIESLDENKITDKHKHKIHLSEIHLPEVFVNNKQKEIISDLNVVTDSTRLVIHTRPKKSDIDELSVDEKEKKTVILGQAKIIVSTSKHVEPASKEPQQEIVVDKSHLITDSTNIVVSPLKMETNLNVEHENVDESNAFPDSNTVVKTQSIENSVKIKPTKPTITLIQIDDLNNKHVKTNLSDEQNQIVTETTKNDVEFFSKPRTEVVVESTDVITEKTILNVAEENFVSDEENYEKETSSKRKLHFPHFRSKDENLPEDSGENLLSVTQMYSSFSEKALDEKSASQANKSLESNEIILNITYENSDNDKFENLSGTTESKKIKKKLTNPFSKFSFGKKINQKEVVVNDGHIYTDNSTLGRKKKVNVHQSGCNTFILENDLPESKESKQIAQAEAKKEPEDLLKQEKVTDIKLLEKKIRDSKIEQLNDSNLDFSFTESSKLKKKNTKTLNIFNRNSGEYDLEHPSKTNQPLVELISSKPKLETCLTDNTTISKYETQPTTSIITHQSNITMDFEKKPAFESDQELDLNKFIENVQVYQPIFSKKKHLDLQRMDITETGTTVPTNAICETSTPIKSKGNQIELTTDDKISNLTLTEQPSSDEEQQQQQQQEEEKDTDKTRLNWLGCSGRNTSYFSTVSRVTTCHDERTPLQFVVVAIDFGTTFSGYAFSFTKDIDSIHVMRKWEGGDPGVTNQKTPTILLLTPNKEFHSFGFTARDFYHDLGQKEAKKWLYFEKFKMALHYYADLNSESELNAANGVPMKALDVFAHALRFFRNHALLEISEQSNTPINEDDIRWVITVPAIWKAPAKQFMREAAYKAGIASSDKQDSLVIALEPEAASVFVRRQRLRQLIPELADELKDARGVTPKKSDSNNRSSDLITASPVTMDSQPYQAKLDESSSWNQSVTSNALSMSFQRCPSPTSFPVSVGHEIDITDNRFMVADCGGGTVDITVYEMLSVTRGNLKEIYKATGGPHGSIGVDIEFETLLYSIFGHDFIEAFKLKRPAGWVDLMMAFESRKRAANPFKTKPLNVSLPFSFIDYHKKYKNSTVESAVRKFNDKNVIWSSQGMLRLMPEAMNSLFQPTLDNITKSIDDVISQPDVAGIKHIFLVGGFAESPMLQQEVRKKFDEKARILIPNDVSLSILKGAVLYGIDPSVVAIRKSRLTYGLGVLNRFVDGKHPESKKAMKDGTPWCVDVFDHLVLADQSVALGSSVIRSYTPASVDQKFSLFHIYCSEDRNVAYVTDEGVAKCGTLRLDLDDHQWDLESNPSRPVSQNLASAHDGETSPDFVEKPRGRREIQARLTFGDTEIKIVALDVVTGNYVRATLDFLNK